MRDEEPRLALLRTPQVLFVYSAAVVNVGLKPVRIENICIDYGGETFDTSSHLVVDGRSDVPPQGERHIKFELRRDQYEETFDRLVDRVFRQLRWRT